MVPVLLSDVALPPPSHALTIAVFAVRARVEQSCLVSARGASCSGARSPPPVIRKQPDGRVVIEF